MLFGATRSTGLIKKALYSPLLRNGLMTLDHRGQNQLHKYRTWEDGLMGAAIKWEQKNFTTHWRSIAFLTQHLRQLGWLWSSAVTLRLNTGWIRVPEIFFSLKQLSHSELLSMRNWLYSVKIVESNHSAQIIPFRRIKARESMLIS